MLFYRIKMKASRWSSLGWRYTYAARAYLAAKVATHSTLLLSLLSLALASVSIFLHEPLQRALECHVLPLHDIDKLSQLVLATGSALIGATAIVFSLVLFAIQVNIERMPHGLFRRLSVDARLLGTFVIAFVLALILTGSSTVVNESRAALTILSMFWIIVIILILFLYAYRRALTLVSPNQQLAILLKDTQQHLQSWERKARRITPLIEPESKSLPKGSEDVARVKFFRFNQHWTNKAVRAIRHSISYSRRYAEQGDHEISAVALKAIVLINREYVSAKGKTFFANTLLLDDPRVTDSFINETLELIRQEAQSAVKRGDERQTELLLRAFSLLAMEYLKIEYPRINPDKTHAQLAAGYLSNEVQKVTSHEMVDVSMEGVRLMGGVAQAFIPACGANSIQTIADKIAVVSAVGCVKEAFRPVLSTGMEQLAAITFNLIRSEGQDIHFAAEKVRRNVTEVAKIFLAVPDTPFLSIHSSCLAPYYSSTSIGSLRGLLSNLANAILHADANESDAKTVIGNFERWSYQLFVCEKELLLAAIKAKSAFVFDIINWITGVTEILLAIANAPACEPYFRDKLHDNARWLICSLSWIPKNKEAINLVETFSFTESLFDAAASAYRSNAPDVGDKISELLLSWSFKGGQFGGQHQILEAGVVGCAALALSQGEAAIGVFKQRLSASLAAEPYIDDEIRVSAAEGIKRRAASMRRDCDSTSSIDVAISRTDDLNKVRQSLKEIYKVLLPGGAET